MATKKLKELLEARKSTARDTSGIFLLIKKLPISIKTLHAMLIFFCFLPFFVLFFFKPVIANGNSPSSQVTHANTIHFLRTNMILDGSQLELLC